MIGRKLTLCVIFMFGGLSSRRSSVVERIHGKDEVTSSILVVGSKYGYSDQLDFCKCSELAQSGIRSGI